MSGAALPGDIYDFEEFKDLKPVFYDRVNWNYQFALNIN